MPTCSPDVLDATSIPPTEPTDCDIVAIQIPGTWRGLIMAEGIRINRRNHAEALEASRRQLTQLAQAFQDEAGLDRPISESVGDVLTMDYEDTDLAVALTDRETSGMLVHLLDESREQVERALDRIANGSYGSCE